MKSKNMSQQTPIQTILLCGGLALLSAAASIHAGDWPVYRGPDRNGISPEAGWSVQWPASGPKQAWKVNVGIGFGTVSVSQGKVYTMGNANDTDTVFCLDEKTGAEVWKYSYPCKLDPKNFEGGPGSTPTVAGGRIYTFSRFGHVHALDANGKVIWAKNVMSDYGAARPTWGFAGSVLIEGNLAIVNAGASGIALNKDTGEAVWKSNGTGGYSTPVLFDNEGTKAVALFSAKSVVAVALADGKKVWEHEWKTSYDVNAADPIFAGNKFFVSSGYDRGCALVEFKGGQTKALWENKNMRNHFANCVWAGDYIYGFDGNTGSGSLSCLDAKTGEVKWKQSGLTTGGLMVAGGRIVALADKGKLVIAEASPAGYKELASAKILDGRKCWTMPVLANGRIYARNNSPGDLICFDVSGK